MHKLINPALLFIMLTAFSISFARVQESREEPTLAMNPTYIFRSTNDYQPYGATAKCKDATYSFSKTFSTCISHGGVAEKLRD